MSDKKLDLFKDKEYEEFDWLNRAIEPLIFSLAEDFAKIPSLVEMPLDRAIKFASGGWYKQIDMHSILSHSGVIIHHSDYENIREFFLLELSEPITEIDLRNVPQNVMVKVAKTVDAIPDDKLRQIAASRVQRLILDSRSRDLDIGRLNEVMDILGCENNRRSRSGIYKLNTISSTFVSIIVEDKWRIRNLDLALKAAHWMTHYIKDGNMASFQNFIKMKCMTHSGNPIYSVQETI